VSAVETPAAVEPRLLSLRRLTGAQSLSPRPVLWIGLGIVALLFLLGFLAPTLTGHSATTQHLTEALKPPGGEHLLGTDQYGRDVLTRTLSAARLDIPIAFGLVALSLLIGTTIGILASWAGGLTDAVVARLIDVALAFPFLVLVVAIVAFRGPGVGSLFIAVGFTGWVYYSRLTRGEVMIAKRMDYMRAARASGFSRRRILTRHLLPNVIVQPLVFASSDLVYALLLGASVSFLGLGVQAPTPEWGAMVFEGKSFVTEQWWVSFFPGLAIVVCALAFSMIGDGAVALTGDGDD
jgi:peptide/nickel transport system permease protein